MLAEVPDPSLEGSWLKQDVAGAIGDLPGPSRFNALISFHTRIAYYYTSSETCRHTRT
jgi:hypothetical protein